MTVAEPFFVSHVETHTAGEAFENVLADVGGWEDNPEIHRPAGWDGDGDGIPDQWETGKGLNPGSAADGALDPDGDGYTNLEDYLNWLAAGNTLN